MTDRDVNSMSSDSAMLNQHITIGPIHEEDHRYDQLEEQERLQSHQLQRLELQPQQQEQNDAEMIHGISTPKLSYKDLSDRINDKTYDRSVFVKWKRKNSESMDKITNSLNALNAMLNKSLAETDYTSIKNSYLVLSKQCLTYLSTHNPITDEGKARLDLVQKIYDRVMSDRHNLDVNAGHLKDTQRNNYTTWNYMIEDHTVLHIPRDKIKVPEGQELSGSSTVTKLVGEKTYYLKNQEVMPSTGEISLLKVQLKDEYMRELQEIDNPQSVRYGGMSAEQKERKRQAYRGLVDLMTRLDAWIDAVGPVGMAQMSEEYWNKNMIGQQEAVAAYNLTEADKVHFLTFTRELSKKNVQFDAGKKTAKIPPGSVLDSRNEATSVLAETLGISDMIMDSRSMDVEIEGEQIRILRMEQVFGINGFSDMCKEKYLGKTIQMSPKALKQFQTLQIFDVICGQVDRNENNILLQTVEEGDKIIIKSITGIDNDLSFGMLTYNDITFRVNKRTQKAVKQGYLNPIEDLKHGTYLAGVDKEFADRILELKPEMLKYVLGPYVSKEEILACQDRLKGVQQHLRSLASRDKGKKPEDRFMISSEEGWAQRLKGLESSEGLDEHTQRAHEAYMDRMTKHSLIREHYLNKRMDQFPSIQAWQEYQARKAREQNQGNGQGQQ